MSDEIIKILDDLGQRFGIAIDWSSQNVMPYLKDLVSRFTSYEVLTSIMWIVVLVLVIIGCFIGIPQIVRYTNRKISEDEYSNWVFGKVLIVGLFVFIIGISINAIIQQIMDIITCYTIPEKMILEYINYLSSN